MTKQKVLAVAGILGIAALVLSAGTLAYFTDTDKETNTFTIGSVDIDLIESQLHRVNAGVQNGSTSTSPLWTPGVTMEGAEDTAKDHENVTWNGQYFSDAQIEADAANYKAAGGYFDTASKDMVPGESVRKAPYIKNVGKSDAYVRLRALIPVSLFYVLAKGPSMWTSTALGQNVSSPAVERYNAHFSSYSKDEYNTYIDAERAAGRTVYRNEVEYLVFDFIYNTKLESGNLTFWNAWGNIAIDKHATSEDLANVDSFDVIFEADGIQATGFDSATAAFAAFDAQENS